MDFNKLKNLDVFSKTKANARVQTRVGAILSLIATFLMLVLIISEFSRFLAGNVTTELSVDTSFGANIRVNLDVTFHHLPCAFISVNVMDKTGNHQLDIHHDITTERLNRDGEPLGGAEKEIIGSDTKEADVPHRDQDYCGDCYGAESKQYPCCKTCEDVAAAYHRKGWAFVDPNGIEQCVKEKYLTRLHEQKDEACRVHGFLTVSRVAGNFNIVPGKFFLQNSRFVVDSRIFSHELGVFNASHTVNHLSFGAWYPGMFNPLDGKTKIWRDKSTSPMYEYFVKIVPTIYIQGSTYIETNQYSVMDYVQTLGKRPIENGVSGFFVLYDLSPVTVYFTQEASSFLHFLTNLCAIIGGIYTIFSLIDSFYYSGIDTLKAQLGKEI